MKKIWIDLDNTPHIPFFRPIIDQLNERGYQLKITARDAFQVYDLADYFHLKYQRIGRHYGKSKLMKVVGSMVRALQLALVMRQEKPALAVSHGSRTQLLAAAILGIPSVMIYDYEYAKGLVCLHPSLVMVPEVIPDSILARWKAAIYKYPGIKEDVYVPGFTPDPAIQDDLCIAPDAVLITIRPPADEAHYHSYKSQDLYVALMGYLAEKPEVRMVLLPRNKKQEEYARASWPDLIQQRKIIIPDRAMDGLNLIWFSDLVVSGGGTMNREAAALGVPVYSIFRSQIGAVDRYLAESGRLVLLESPDDFQTKLVLSRRDKERQACPNSSRALDGIVGKIVEVTESV